MSEKKAIKRDDHGRIVEGSGPLNPEGRPKGAKSFTTLVVEAMERKIGEEKTYNEFLAEALAEFLVTGTFTTVDGTTIHPRSGDFLNFIMSVWKKLEPGTTRIDLTSAGERLDFGGMNDDELQEFIQSRIRESGSGFSGSGAPRADSEDSAD